jgi:hypothetical protein
VSDLTGGPDRRAMLGGFLDWFRAVVVRKLDGLDREAATRVATPTGLTLLGIVQHLGWAERLWFGHYLLGGPHEPVDATTAFVVAGDATVDSVIEEYEAACAESRAVLATSPLDRVAAVRHQHFGDVTLEWIVVHLIEETARHAGHMDILRELTDGRTGD